jgi:hypothetical protein
VSILKRGQEMTSTVTGNDFGRIAFTDILPQKGVKGRPEAA